MPQLNLLTGRLTGPLAALLLAFAVQPALAQTTTEEGAAEAEAPAAAEEAPEIEVLSEYDASTVVATANGVPITLGELIAVRQTIPEQYQQLPGEVLFEALSEQLTTQVLMAKAAREAGLADQPGVQIALQIQTIGILADRYMREEVAKLTTEDKIVEAYAARYANAEPQEEVRAGHILVESPEKAAELKAQIDGGAEFAALAAEHGTDGTAQRGGDLGWFVHSDMVPEFADAAFAMEPGQVSDPVESPFGWHLIKLEERRERAAPPLEQVYGEIQAELAQQAQNTVIAEIMRDVEIVKPEVNVPGEAIKQDDLLQPAE
ncbi:MAG: peptidylprolyl isomerase [Pseudomonadota bacterium]